jgi:hypothetical protein
MKKIILLFTIFLLSLSFAYGADFCIDNVYTVGGTVTDTAYTNIPNTFSTNYRITEITSIIPDATIRLTKCINYNITNGTTTTLAYSKLNATLKVYNYTDQTILMPAGNYTYNATLGTISWNNLTIAKWNNTEVLVCYNKTYSTSTNIVSDDEYYTGAVYTSSVGTTGSYWTLLNNDLNGTDWDVTYNYWTQDCSVSTQCNNTKGILFAGFGLIALAAIVLAAFLIVNMVRDSQFDAGSIIAIVISIIALSVVILVGYIITAAVAANVCG